MNTIIRNAKLLTSTTSLYDIHIANGVIQDILPSGDYEATSNTIDAKGNFVFPGFNDSHLHLMGLGATLTQCNLNDCRSIKDVIVAGKEFLTNNELTDNEPLMGRGWNQDNFTQTIKPSRSDLDEISINRPIIFRRACGHMLVANSKAIAMIKKIEPVEGGSYDLELGHFEENAMDLILNELPLPSLAMIKRYILTAQRHLHRMGITSVGSDDLCVFPKSHNDVVFNAFDELDSSGELTIKVYEQSLFRDVTTFKQAIANGYTMGARTKNFYYGPLKILLDGSLGARTAYLSSPYHDDPSTHGIIMYDQETLNTYIYQAHTNAIDVAVHCIGDQALTMALNAFESAISKHSFPHRHSIVHCQITSTDQLKRMQSLNIGALAQPIFIDYDHKIVHSRVGQDLAKTSYAFKTMKDLGLRVAYGSDAPVEDANPLKGMFCSMARTGLHGREPYNINEAVTFTEAIEAFTVEGAYYMHMEHTLGQIKKGMIADLTCVSKLKENDLASIRDGKVIFTIANGHLVYKE